MHHVFWRETEISPKALSVLLLKTVGELIGSGDSEGQVGLGQTITSIQFIADYTGNEFLSTLSSYYAGVYSFSRLPEKLNVQALNMSLNNPLSVTEFALL